MMLTDRVYADVPASSETVSDTIIPTGVWEIQSLIGSAAYLDDTIVCVIWDPAGTPQILGCTHGDADNTPNVPVTGDGVKVLRIALTNDTLDPRIMGASWIAKKIS